PIRLSQAARTVGRRVDPMTGEPDALEVELAALRPCVPSPDLRRRIGERIARPAASKTWRWAIAAAGLLAVGLAVFLWPAPPTIESHLPPVVPPPVLESEEPPPTAWDYRQALSRSPEALEELLDR